MPDQQQLMMQQQAMISQSRQAMPKQRGRGRAQTKDLAARIPSNASKKNVNSATRGSRHGSKKRTQKTRSSLNIGLASSNRDAAGFPGGLASMPNQVIKSQKLAAQIYGTSDGMMSNLVSNRKKPTSKGKKRSQPSQMSKKMVQRGQQQEFVDPN